MKAGGLKVKSDVGYIMNSPKIGQFKFTVKTFLVYFASNVLVESLKNQLKYSAMNSLKTSVKVEHVKVGLIKKIYC